MHTHNTAQQVLGLMAAREIPPPGEALSSDLQPHVSYTNGHSYANPPPTEGGLPQEGGKGGVFSFFEKIRDTLTPCDVRPPPQPEGEMLGFGGGGGGGGGGSLFKSFRS